MDSNKKKIIVAVNSTWNVWNFRMGLLRSLREHNYDVVVVTPSDRNVEEVQAAGFRWLNLPIDSSSVNPLREIFLILRYIAVFIKERPDFVLAFTPKPNIYCGLASYFFATRLINNIAGLGVVFSSGNSIARFLAGFLYKVALRRSHVVFFQNNEDRSYFLSSNLISSRQSSRIPGSGVNLDFFKFSPSNERESCGLKFLFVGRLLWDKGVLQYVEAAKIVKNIYPKVSFGILGIFDEDNPVGISRAQMFAWQDSGVVEFYGSSDDVRPFIIDSDCVVLPSYYGEGVPKSLLEASAVGRPVIASDSVGCRDAVIDGVTGFLCAARDSQNLAEVIFKFIRIGPDIRCEFGVEGRRNIERFFDEGIVISRYLDVIRNI